MIETAEEPRLPQEPRAPQETETPHERKFRNSWKDWVLRITIFVVFLFFASGKFKNASDAPWVVLFTRIGFGHWLRYLTGVLETIGAVLVLFSRTIDFGLAILAAVMLGAIIVVVAILHRPADAFVAFAFLCAIGAFWMHRRRV
jgi:uncharacterized membrane protein YphA (DoxX/SURF4 family)